MLPCLLTFPPIKIRWPQNYFEILKEFLVNSDWKSRCLCFLAYKFIHGTQYTRIYSEKLNESYANETNCILTSFRVDTNETIKGYQYDCTEKAKLRKYE